MWQSVLITLIAIGIAFYEIPKLKKNGFKKEIWVFSILLAIATVANILEFLIL